jgi:hypothetical protein
MTILRKLLWQIRRKQKEEELAEELRFHLNAERQELGEEAARRAVGNLGLVKEDTRSAWGWVWVEQLFQDIRYALRGMRRNPGFTLLACLSLALGIGANTAMYSFMDALFLRILPVGEPDRLVVLNWHNKIEDHTVFHGGSGSVYDDAKYGHSARIFPYPAFEMFEKSADAFSVVRVLPDAKCEPQHTWPSGNCDRTVCFRQLLSRVEHRAGRGPSAYAGRRSPRGSPRRRALIRV